VVSTPWTVPIPRVSAQPAQRSLENPPVAVIERRRRRNRHRAPSEA
jgi:hypothetical protein